MLLGKLNWIRKQHPALQQLHQLTVHPTSNDNVLAFSKRIEARFSPTGADDTVLVIVNLDPFITQESFVNLNMEALGLDPSQPFHVHDELGGTDHQWRANAWVRLDPRVQVAHVMSVSRV